MIYQIISRIVATNIVVCVMSFAFTGHIIPWTLVVASIGIVIHWAVMTAWKDGD